MQLTTDLLPFSRFSLINKQNQKHMQMKNIRLVLLASLALQLPWVSADMVTEWNATLEQGMINSAKSPGEQPRLAAIVQAAVYDAVNGIARRYEPYFVTEPAPPGARQEAAAMQAAYTTLKALLPASQGTFLEAKLEESLAKIPGHPGKSQSIARGREWGQYVAETILAWRSTDGWTTPPVFMGGSGPGEWRSLPQPGFPDGSQSAAFSQQAILVPFAMTSPSQFRPGPPPALTSVEYANDVNEVKLIGSVSSAVRTAEQTLVARLWHAAAIADENRMVRSILPPGNSLVENARLLAAANIAACDAFEASMESKFAYNLWRPHHAIRLADTDENPLTEADPGWTALILAPRFPEYVSNHSTITGAFLHVFASELGDNHTVVLSAPALPGFTRTYNRLSDAAAEVQEARILAGIHFRTACRVGQEVGVAVADYVLENFFLPLH